MTTPPPAKSPSARKRTPITTRVQSSTRLSPGLVRLVLVGEGLRAFPVGAFTDHYVKLHFPPVTRTFTVRGYDETTGELTIDFVVHGDGGIAGAWAARAAPGDEITLQGPGGGYTPETTAAWHLFVGDASALPAIAVALQRLPAGALAHVVLAVDGPDEQQHLPTAATAHIRWLHSTDSAAEDLLVAVRALEFPTGAVDAFVHGEAAAVRAVRRHLLTERGVPRAALSASGYWKRGRTDEGWRADKPDWKRLAALDEAPAG